MPAGTLPESPVLTVTTVSRPKRVAFLVHPTNATTAEVDEIIRFSAGCWGGRHNVIVPTDGEVVPPDWAQFLTAIDPDVIYSLVPLDSSLVDWINRKILPAKILGSKQRSDISGEHLPRIDAWSIGALGVHGIPRYLWEHRTSVGEPRFCWTQLNSTPKGDHSFVSRNFGVLPNDLHTQDMFRQDLPVELVTLGDASGAPFLDRILTRDRRLTTVLPLDIAAACTPSVPSAGYASHLSGFHLAVGDDPWDIIYYWNYGALGQQTSGRNMLWMPASLAANDAFLAQLAVWIRHDFWHNPHERRGVIVSSTLSQNALETLAERLRTAADVPFYVRRIGRAEFPFPGVAETAAVHTGDLTGIHSWNVTVQRVPVSDNKAHAAFERPAFLTESSGQMGWMVDAQIEYHPERHYYTNVRPSWVLPRRIGLPELFFEHDGRQCARIAGIGLPSIEVAPSDQTIRLSIPSDFVVTWTCCFGSTRVDTERAHDARSSRFEDLSISDKGRHLSGAVQLLGSLHHAWWLLRDPFWRNLVMIMAGRANAAERLHGRVERIQAILREEITRAGGCLELRDPVERSLAEALVGAENLEPQVRSLTVDEMKGHFARLRGDVLRRDPQNQFWTTYRSFDILKLDELEMYRRLGLFVQGVEIRCPICFTTLWHTVDSIRTRTLCEGCGGEFLFPTSPEWKLRLNALFANALRHQGLRPVLEALCDRSQRAMGAMFLFVPCANVHEKPAGSDGQNGLAGNAPVFTDLDLIYIHRGRFIIGEVKTSPDGFRPSQLDKLKIVALDFRPDEVVLAAIGTEWPNAVRELMDSFSQELREADIRVVPLLIPGTE